MFFTYQNLKEGSFPDEFLPKEIKHMDLLGALGKFKKTITKIYIQLLLT